MKEIYDRYYEHFSQLNSTDLSTYNNMAKIYHSVYGDQLPKNRNCKILDIGCGMGHFIYYMKTEGFKNCYGIDISPQQVEFVKKNITEHVEVADALEYLKEDIKYDLICMNDVIEHIPKHALMALLKLLYDRLSADGVLLIKTDNMSTPFGLRGRYMDVTHEIGFTEHSLYEVLTISGFKEITIRGADPMQRTLIHRIIRDCVHRIIGAMFYFQGYPVPRVLNKDVVAIAKK